MLFFDRRVEGRLVSDGSHVVLERVRTLERGRLSAWSGSRTWPQTNSALPPRVLEVSALELEGRHELLRPDPHHRVDPDDRVLPGVVGEVRASNGSRRAFVLLPRLTRTCIRSLGRVGRGQGGEVFALLLSPGAAIRSRWISRQPYLPLGEYSFFRDDEGVLRMIDVDRSFRVDGLGFARLARRVFGRPSLFGGEDFNPRSFYERFLEASGR